MELSLGIRLVIIFPTLLFLIGFSLKAIIEREGMTMILDEYKKIYNKKSDELRKTFGPIKIVDGLWKDFAVTLIIDSILLVIANGLIIIYELQLSELGIVAIITGFILSIFLLIVAFIHPIKNGFIIGLMGLFGFFGGEFAFFSLYGTFLLTSFLFVFLVIIIALLFAVVGGLFFVKSYPIELYRTKKAIEIVRKQLYDQIKKG